MNAEVEVAHQEFPAVFDLAGRADPELLLDYFKWLTEDPVRMQSAVDSMQRLAVGFDTLSMGTITNQSGEVIGSLQANFYRPAVPGNEEPHAHAKNACTVLYAPYGSHQVVERYQILPDRTPWLNDVPVEEQAVVANTLVDYRDGRRPGYRVHEIGSRLVRRVSSTFAAPLTVQSFKSTEVHSIKYRGDGVAVSLHFKGRKEPDILNEREGLVYYKGLTADEADEIVAVRQQERVRLLEGTVLGPTTLFFTEPDFKPPKIQAEPEATPSTVGERLIEDALATVEKLAA